MKTLIPWCLVAVLSVLLLAAAQQNSAPPAKAQQPPAGQPAQQEDLQEMGRRMIVAIKETEGCLGVSTGQLSENREAIFAFFENKEAAMRWYNHPMHQHLRGLMPGVAPQGYKPMQNVPDGVPVLAVAAISYAGEPAMKDSPIPFSSISIELYTPATGGLRINGGFAPEKFSELAQQKVAGQGQ